MRCACVRERYACAPVRVKTDSSEEKVDRNPAN